ncbi:hypothetical protein PHYSODRAFT_505723 [Phytophthora sojae]|uniref:Uncharacterized protein n=1 Tax=Phytophthora sojae (strain P6497) TaxID=1094619 RepID=G4ZPK3_PHYSP|nr:hypothetical protein PHYSODRAFT_505723 [Phytophthora sojae]EGZ16315.1 hypothetical protein PHYSODRAFT_505723 [Phytophthora sojae]|eukprot:XP_009530064.1 hypothetical protein PHYSODRAFT_505723 [Phytophthora sojae]
MPSSVPLKILRSSAYAEAPGQSSPDSGTPSCGLSGQPWKTPTRSEIGAVVPASHSSANGTLPNALRKSYQTSKLCSPQPLTARKPFCPGAWRSFASIHRTSRRARTPV